MRYIVDVNEQRHEVDVLGEAATLDGTEAVLEAPGGSPVRVLRIGDRVVRVTARRDGKGCYTLDVDGYRYVVEALDERTRTIRDLTAKSGAASGPAPVIAPMPGLVVRVSVAPGDVVQPGQAVAVMEAMKMENELRVTAAGTVKAVRVTPGTAVEKGTVLVELE